MAKKRPAAKRSRTERREVERAGVKLAHARLELALLEPGGSAARPIVVSSASLVEPQAGSTECVVCGAATRVEEHSAVTLPDGAGVPRSIRIARVRCTRCGVVRDIYFRIEAALAN